MTLHQPPSEHDENTVWYTLHNKSQLTITVKRREQSHGGHRQRRKSRAARAMYKVRLYTTSSPVATAAARQTSNPSIDCSDGRTE